MAKRTQVPPSAATPALNREQRRHPERLIQPTRPEDQVPLRTPLDDMIGADRAPDDLSVRAKSSGHGKKTADKWNQ